MVVSRFWLVLLIGFLGLNSPLGFSEGLPAPQLNTNSSATTAETITHTGESGMNLAQSPSPAPTTTPAPASPGPLKTILETLKRRRGLLILGFGSIFVTIVSVFILLKLFDEDPLEAETESPSSEPLNSEPIANPSENNHHHNSIPNSDPKVLPLLAPAPPEPLPVKITPSPAPLTFTDPVAELMQNLQHPDPENRHQAIWRLGEVGDSRAIAPLVNLLTDSDSKQQSLILATLSEISGRTLKPLNRALTLSLQNENSEVRKNAIRDLTRIYELINQASHLLERALDDPDPEVQETAQWAIKQLNRVQPSDYR